MSDARRALVISAHPDDIEFGCAGTTCLLVDQGWDVRYVIVTSGQRGVQDPRADPDTFGRVREAESLEAARIVGVTNVTFLRYMDSEVLFVDQHALRKDLSRQFRIHRPHRVFTMDPAMLPGEGFVNHPDHRAVGTAALDITLTGGTTAAIHPELVFDEELEPWRELEEIWVFGPAGGGEVVDITSTIDRKLEALAAHTSQVPPETVDFMRERVRVRAAETGFEYAETFRVLARRP